MHTVKDINLTLIKLTLHATALYPPSAIHTLCPPCSSQYGDDSCFQFPAERLSKGQATWVLACLNIAQMQPVDLVPASGSNQCAHSDMHQVWWLLIWSGLIWCRLWYVLNLVCMAEQNNTLVALGWIKISHLKLNIKQNIRPKKNLPFSFCVQYEYSPNYIYSYWPKVMSAIGN